MGVTIWTDMSVDDRLMNIMMVRRTLSQRHNGRVSVLTTAIPVHARVLNTVSLCGWLLTVIIVFPSSLGRLQFFYVTEECEIRS